LTSISSACYADGVGSTTDEFSRLNDDLKYWLGFSLIPNIGAKRLIHLLNAFGDLEVAWHANHAALRDAKLGPKTTDKLVTMRHTIDLDRELATVKQSGARLITLRHPDYPVNLRNVDDPPPLLYVRGTLFSHDEKALAVVGTRRATRYGRDVTYDISRKLAQQGVTIVSGLAHGVDTAAHTGALDGGGRTIAVLGCGIDTIYPHDNRPLAERILTNGAIISEFPLGTKPLATNFPRRNRVISGLSLGVLVTEAPDQSGALITTTQAADQGRDVFAIPGNIFSAMSHGTNRLIQDGATLVMNERDVLDALDLAYTSAQTRVKTERVAPSTDIERQILNQLDANPIHIDDLVRQSGLPTAQVSSTLTILELKGLAQMVGQMQYSRTNDVS
jgi:DNA processing protein